MKNNLLLVTISFWIVTPTSGADHPQESTYSLPENLKSIIVKDNFDASIDALKRMELPPHIIDSVLKDVSKQLDAPASFIAYALGTSATKQWLGTYFKESSSRNENETLVAILNEMMEKKYVDFKKPFSNFLSSKYGYELAKEIDEETIIGLYRDIKNKESGSLIDRGWFPRDSSLKALCFLSIKLSRFPQNSLNLINKLSEIESDINQRRTFFDMLHGSLLAFSDNALEDHNLDFRRKISILNRYLKDHIARNEPPSDPATIEEIIAFSRDLKKVQ